MNTTKSPQEASSKSPNPSMLPLMTLACFGALGVALVLCMLLSMILAIPVKWENVEGTILLGATVSFFVCVIIAIVEFIRARLR